MFEAQPANLEEQETIFCFLSGENPTLPPAEVEAILDAERSPAKILSRHLQVLQLRSTVRGAEAVVRRAAYTRRCCEEVFSCEAKESRVLEAVRASRSHRFFKGNGTFQVEVAKIGPESPFETRGMEKAIGQAILDIAPDAKVKLERSDKTFLGVAVDNLFFLGLAIGGPQNRLESRKPHLRPFFHPSAMQPKLARCMVNLSRAKTEGVFFDPFCGTGSLLVEGGLVGCRVLGSDIDRKMVSGASKNLAYSGVEEYSLCVADARKLPFRAFDSCASDPPYGRGSSTHGADAREIVAGFLREVFDLLAHRSHVCLAFPEEGNIGELGRTLGYEVCESHLVREHKSLTREVIVLRRP